MRDLELYAVRFRIPAGTAYFLIWINKDSKHMQAASIEFLRFCTALQALALGNLGEAEEALSTFLSTVLSRLLN